MSCIEGVCQGQAPDRSRETENRLLKTEGDSCMEAQEVAPCSYPLLFSVMGFRPGGRGSVLNETMFFAHTKAERGDVYGSRA